MGTHERLVHAWTPAVRSLRPDSEMEAARAMVGAINRDGTINPLAIFNVLPWQPRDFYVTGTAAIAANVGPMLRIRQESRLVYIDAYAKTAPSGGEWQGVIAVTGASDLENIAISSGETAGTSPSNVIIPAGSLLQLNCIAANSAANVTVTIWTVPVLA
jgi:hypothetical protein